MTTLCTRILLAAVLLLAACAGAAPRPADLDDVMGSWQLAGDVPAGARRPTMTISHNGELSGNSGVNRFRSSINAQALASGHWRAGPVMGTRMAGTEPAMALEGRFIRGLEAANRAEMEGSALLLMQGETLLLRFERVRIP